MSYKRINEQYLTDIAEAIRNKNGTDQTYKPRELAAAVSNLKTDVTQFYSSIDGSITKLHDSLATVVGEYRYCGCSNLTTVDLPNVTSIGDSAFDGCDKLTTIKLPSVTDIGKYAFFLCRNLTTVDLSNAINIETGAFVACNLLTIIDLPKATNIRLSAFIECDNLSAIILRSSTKCTLQKPGIPLSNSNLYIYVPAALLPDYRTAYPDYNFRSIENYPEICG